MPYPNDTSTVATGQTHRGGRAAPVALPTWLTGRALNEWKEIPNTGGGGGAALEEFSGFALAGTRLVGAASGGHGVSDNRVVAIDLSLNAPAWVQLNPPSAFADVIPDAGRNADGKPNSRHTRYNIQWMAALNRVMLLGARDLYTAISPGSQPTVDGFNLDTNTWDVGTTYPDVLGGTAYVDGGACIDPNGDGWVGSSERKFDKTTKTWSAPLTAVAAKRVRYPWSTSAARNMMFGLCYGDGWGYSVSLGVCAIMQVGNVQTQITFNSSTALTQFIADVPAEAGMDYDSINDNFLFCSGSPAGRIYKIIPNAGTVWDMEIFSYGAGNIMPVASVAGTQSRFKYIPEYKGFVLLPTRDGNLQFLKTA